MDHQPLVYLRTVKEPGKKQIRWITQLSKYDVRIQYRPGLKNYLSDTLSRLHTKEEETNTNYLQDPTIKEDDIPATLNFHDEPLYSKICYTDNLELRLLNYSELSPD